MIKEHGGRIIDTAGDGILAEFGSVVSAAECAVAIQRTMAERNANVEEARRMRFRIGINQGDVLFDDSRVYGDGVNVAARLENLAEPGGICISRRVFEDIAGKMQLTLVDLGEQQLKNIAQPLRVYRVLGEQLAAARATAMPMRTESKIKPAGASASAVCSPLCGCSGLCPPDAEKRGRNSYAPHGSTSRNCISDDHNRAWADR
jgi:adenylate cyclase